MAERLGVVVIDGGTDAGVMHLIGRARTRAEATFPLVGVPAVGTVRFPGKRSGVRRRWPLDAHHTHFVLVPGAAWGDEAPWIARVGTELAGGSPSVTVLVNGGRDFLQGRGVQPARHAPGGHRRRLRSDRRPAGKGGQRGGPADERAIRLAARAWSRWSTPTTLLPCRMPSAPGCSRRSEVGSHPERSEAQRCCSTVEAVTE